MHQNYYPHRSGRYICSRCGYINARVLSPTRVVANIYKPSYLPCEHCHRKKNFTGSNAANRISPTKPFPLSPEDRQVGLNLHLHYYTDSADFEKRDFILWSLVKKSQVAFGNWVCRSSLRHTLLALSAAVLPQDGYEPYYLENRNRAHKELQVVIHGRDGILDSDVLAAFVLAVLATFKSLPDETVTAYAEGCMLMLGICEKNSRRRSTASSVCMLRVFGPLILDWLEILHLRCVDQDRWKKTVHLRSRLADGLTPFAQRVRYLHSEHAEWRSNLGRAIRYTVSILAGRLMCILPIIASNEYNGQFAREGLVTDVLDSVKTELADPNYKVALEKSELWNEQIPIRYTIPP